MNKKRCPVLMVIMAVAVLLLASSCAPNYRPIITSLEADAPWIAPLGNLRVTCNASDPDGDELSYKWSTSGGDITGTGPEVTWTAPEETGMYDITVVVKDDRGREATGLIALIASNGPPPVIEDLVVTAEHPYLRKSIFGYDYDVLQTREYDIECIASGNGTLSYNWSRTGGNISGEGSNITWTAPDMFGDSAVTVIVSDVAGNKMSKSVDFYVLSCACGF